MSEPAEMPVTHATMGRVAGVLFLNGAALTVVGMVLPHASKIDVNGFWAIAAGTAVAGGLLLRHADRLPERAYPWIMFLASFAVTLSLYFNGERHGGPSAGNQVLYVWIALYAGYFFSRAEMILQLAVIAILYTGALLAIDPGPVALTRWLITVGMVSATSLIVQALKRRNEELVARLSSAARTDALTGLLNRQGFDEQLEAELSRCGRTGQTVALIVADIDCFKAINDQSGHAAGDVALRVVADTARRTARTHDTIARIGGDEFAAILPDTNSESAFLFAERLREAIFARQGEDGALTLSLGISESHADGLTPALLTRSADRALYEAKRRGRNQTAATLADRATTARERARRGPQASAVTPHVARPTRSQA